MEKHIYLFKVKVYIEQGTLTEDELETELDEVEHDIAYQVERYRVKEKMKIKAIEVWREYLAEGNKEDEIF